MSENKGIIKIAEKAEKYIRAVSAKLHLQISGANFFYGNAALEKADEVKSLVEDLAKVGFDGKNIFVKDVTLESDSGIFGKSTKSTYQLDLNVENLDLMGEVLGVVAAQKNCQLRFTEWVFDEDAARLELAKEALIKAKRKADAMAEAVGYKIVGIKECADVYYPLQKDVMRDFAEQGFALRAAKIGAEFQNENKVSAEVSVEFFIERV